MSTIKVDTITDEAGTGAPDFPQGMTGDGSSLTGLATAAQGAKADSAVQPNTSPTFGTVSASSLTGVGSIDSTTATAIENAGVGVPASKSWTNLGTLNLGSPSNGNWATGFVTLDSSYQNGFEGEILWYLTASRVNQSTNADTQKAYGYSGYQAGDVSTSYLHKTDLKLHYNWSTGGVRYLDNLKALMSRKVRLVESQAGYDALPTGVFPPF